MSLKSWRDKVLDAWRQDQKLYLAIIIVGLLFIISWWPKSEDQNVSTLPETPIISTLVDAGLGQIRRLLGSPDIELKGENRSRINLLLLGRGGAKHEGSNLTDSIMIVSLDLKQKQAVMFSIPRDLVVPSTSGQNRAWQKINAINAYAEQDFERKIAAGAVVTKNGGETTQERLSQIFGIPLDYYISVDFEFFKQFIDDIGGIEVMVEKGFVDTIYPTENFGYQTIRFNSGLQKMNGDTALKFIRSRHGSNGENSDFARSKRQQLVLLALLDKTKSFSTLTNPSFISKTLKNLQTNIQTNLSLPEITRLAQMGITWPKNQVSGFTLDDGAGNFLSGSFGNDGSAILIPDTGDYTVISKFFQNYFELRPAVNEQPKILVVNGTKQTGLAKYISDQLTRFGFEVASANGLPANHSGVYSLTSKPATENWLKLWYGISSPVENLSDISPLTKYKISGEFNPSTVLVLGPDQASYFQKILSNAARFERSRLIEEARRAENSSASEALTETSDLPAKTPNP